MGKSVFLWLVAIGLWCYGFSNTSTFLSALGGYSFIAALFLQLALSAMQSPIWDGRAQWTAWAAFAADIYLNFGPVFAPMSRLESTQSWQATAQVVAELTEGQTINAGVFDNVVVALIVSAAIAIVPEVILRQSGGWNAFRKARP